MLKGERDVVLASIILEHLIDTLGIGHKVGLLTMQLHLLLINLTHIQNLVNQVQDSLGVAVNGIDVSQRVRILIANMTFQIGQRTHDEC